MATAAVALVAPMSMPALNMQSTAQAAVNVSVSIGTFYDDLAPYGSWVNYDDNYVFVPNDRPYGWRPYTAGHWVHTRRYGWMWVSNEPFGWATYHYGRWGYAEDIGWYWVPGRRWAPAWVSWRRSSNHLVWAPLPYRGGDVDVIVDVSDIPDVYWVAVPADHFLDVDLSIVVIRDDRERIRFAEEARPLGAVVVRNDVVVNNVVDVGFVEKETKQQVKTVEVKETDDPKQAGKGGEGEVAVFNPEVKAEKNAKPKEVTDVEKVKQEQASKGKQPTQTEQGTTTEQQAQPEEGQTGEQPLKKKKGTAEQTQPKGATTEQQQAQPEEGQTGAEQPIKKKKGAVTQEQTQPEQGQASEEQTTKKKKKGATTEQQQAQPEEGQAGEQPIKKKKGAATEEQAGPAQGQAQEPIKKKKGKAEQAQPEQPQGEEPQSQKSKKGKQPSSGCDPTTGEGCQ
jgi:hypothetical protein